MWLSTALVVTLSAAPLADVWPYAVKRAPDGALEYAFDLTPLKAGKGTPDAVELHGEEQVKAFLKLLPRQATVRVAADGVDVSAGRELEWGALASAFSQVGDGPWTSDNPLAKKPAARLRAALDPEEPKVLVPVDLLAFQVRQLEDAALAGVELDTEWLRRQLFTQVAERAVKRFQGTDGDLREGALALAGRLYAAAACLDEAKLPASLPVEVLGAARADVQRLTHDADALVAPVPWSRTPELSCAWVRTRALAQPFEQSRAGTVAVLTYLLFLEKDAKLAALHQRVLARRDRFLGAPTADLLIKWKEATRGDADGALDRLNEFLDALPIVERRPPGLLAEPTTPFAGFVRQLQGAELSAATEELAAAVQDGRLAPSAAREAAWPVAREAALAALVTDGTKGVSVDGAWRARLKGAFSALQVAHLDGRVGGLDVAPEEHERNGLTVRLNVPPTLAVEPLPEVYARLARSLERLSQALTAEGLGGLQGLDVEGKKGGAVVAEAKRWILRLTGLAKLETFGSAPPSGQDVAEAKRYLLAWRAESARDVRQAGASVRSMGGERRHSAIVGVSRRELVVGFSGRPAVTVVGAPAGLTAQVADQRYLVPVLVTVGAMAPASRRALEVRALRSALDGVQRDATKAEGAFSEALGR
ncbi:MAG: hypothetical protein AMXMBFR34_31500 [Myxococcaceae bacterium]